MSASAFSPSLNPIRDQACHRAYDIGGRLVGDTSVSLSALSHHDHAADDHLSATPNMAMVTDNHLSDGTDMESQMWAALPAVADTIRTGDP